MDSATTTMQKRLLESIILGIDDRDFTIIQESEFTNTGLLRVVPDGYFTSCRYLTYRFGTHAANFQHHCNSPQCNVAPREWWLHYDDESGVRRNIEEIIEWLQQEKGDKLPDEEAP